MVGTGVESAIGVDEEASATDAAVVPQSAVSTCGHQNREEVPVEQPRKLWLAPKNLDELLEAMVQLGGIDRMSDTATDAPKGDESHFVRADRRGQFQVSLKLLLASARHHHGKYGPHLRGNKLLRGRDSPLKDPGSADRIVPCRLGAIHGDLNRYGGFCQIARRSPAQNRAVGGYKNLGAELSPSASHARQQSGFVEKGLAAKNNEGGVVVERRPGLAYPSQEIGNGNLVFLTEPVIAPGASQVAAIGDIESQICDP